MRSILKLPPSDRQVTDDYRRVTEDYRRVTDDYRRVTDDYRRVTDELQTSKFSKYDPSSPKLGVLYKFKHQFSFKYCGLWHWHSGGCIILYIIIHKVGN